MKSLKFNARVFISACFFTFLGFSAISQVTIPDDILRTLKQEHPRLLVSSLKDFEDIKNRAATDDFLKQSVDDILSTADSLVGQPVVTYEFHDGLRMDTRKVYSRCYSLSMAYRLTGNEKYAIRLWANLEAASKFPDWNQDHFLDCATMTHAFAIAYDWLFDVWKPSQRDYLKQQIMGKGLMQGIMFYDKLLKPGQFNWADIDHNWSLVCNGGLAIGALAIADEEPVLAERILKEALSRYPKAVDKFGPDGAYCEGPGYWGYAMKSAVPALSAFETALGTDFGMTQIAGFSKASLFFVSMGGANNRSFNYADASAGTTRAIELFWLANKFKQPEITEMQKQHAIGQQKKVRNQQSPLELLWYKPQKVTSSELVSGNYYRVAEIASLRSNWQDPNAWFVAFKAGENGVNHGHLDIGTFVLDNQGVRWIMDLGAENYNVPGYFGDANTGKGGKRWVYYRCRAEGHNTLVINPDNDEDQIVNAKANISEFKTTDTKSFGIMDISSAYAGKAASVKRGIALLDKKSVLVQDEIVSDKKIELYWFAHTTAKVTLVGNKKMAVLEMDGEKLVAELCSPKNAVFEVMDAKPLPASPQPVQNNKNEGIKKLAIHVAGNKNVIVAVEFKEMNNKQAQTIKTLSNW